MSGMGASDERGGRRHLAVVGGGQAAKWLLFGLAERLARGERALANLRISVFERGWEFGKGFAWSRQNALPEHETSLADPISRVAFGDDQSRQFHDTVTMLRQHGLIVDLRRGIDVVALRREGPALQVIIDGAESVRADAVVLATGHWRPADPLEGMPGYHASPWPAARLQEDVCGRWMCSDGGTRRRVLVLGTYLNALDAVISLAHRVGRFSEDADNRLTFHGPEHFQLVLGSRRGTLPRVWGRAPRLRAPRVMTGSALRALAAADDGSAFLPIRSAIDLLEQEIALELRETSSLGRGTCVRIRVGDTTVASQRRLASDVRQAFSRGSRSRRYVDTIEIPWQAALFSVLPVLSECSHGLSAEDQCEFDERWRTSFFSHAMPMTLSSARKIEALMTSRHLAVMALGERYECLPSRHGFTVGSPGSDARHWQQHFTDVVRAHAGTSDLRHHPSALVRDGLHSGILRPAVRFFRDSRRADAVLGRVGDAALVQRLGKPALVIGGIDVNPDTREITGADSASAAPNSPLLFAMGPLLIGQFLDAHSIGQLIRDSACILDRLTSTQLRTA